MYPTPRAISPFEKGGPGGIFTSETKISLNPPFIKGGGWFAVAIIFGSMLLSACAVGPDYKRPATATDTPSNNVYKETQTGEWKIATPSDIERGNWWDVFGDDELQRLQTQLLAANQSVAAAEARYRQARAAAAFGSPLPQNSDRAGSPGHSWQPLRPAASVPAGHCRD